METASTEVTSIWRRNGIENFTWRIHQYFVDFKSRIHVEIFTSNRCHNFHVDSPFKIDLISTNFPRGVSTSNRWRIDEDVSIGLQDSSTTAVNIFHLAVNISRQNIIHTALSVCQSLLLTKLIHCLFNSKF